MDGTFEKNMRRSYCQCCENQDLKIILSARLECGKCGRKKFVTKNLKPEFGK